MKKLLIMCICGLMITMCACGKKSDEDTKLNGGGKEDAVQENEISQEEQKETIDDWNEILGITSEDDKDTEDKAEDSSPNSDNTTTNTTPNNSGNNNTTEGGPGSDNTEDNTGTEDKKEEEDKKEQSLGAWTKDY